MERWEEFEGATRRAPRFPLQFPLRYKSGGDAEWREGHGANISRSGLLFRVEQSIPPQTPIELAFVLPLQIPGKSVATVACRARVVRQASGAGRGEVFVAAVIESYRFEPTKVQSA
jgi:hypothetical protein